MTNDSLHPHAPRHRRSLEEARGLVDSWRSSGLTQDAYAQREGLPASSVASCCRRVRLADQEEATSGFDFVRLMPESTGGRGGACAVEVVTPGGYRLAIGGLEQLPLALPILRALREVES
jgi:hypothetical protein